LGTNQPVSRDSFFKYTFDAIFQVMNEEFQINNVVIDVFLISEEQFIIDSVKYILTSSKMYILTVILA
jgi:hypothetical protein